GRSGRSRRVIPIALGAGLLAALITRWPVSFPLAALAVLGTEGLAGNTSKPVIARLEAVASWTEMLRDTLVGAAGLTQALAVTAPIAPRPIRREVATLANRVSAGVSLAGALVAFAGDLSEPAADTVVAALTLAANERSPHLTELLGVLADTTREEVAVRLRVEASRASARTAVRTIAGFSLGLFALMALFARAYLSPYRTLTGQLVLALVGCIFGLGLWLMAVMVRPRVLGRLSLRVPPR
ncbi:MAG: type II secretion system F family protein, partial [Actinomycetota bacterium]|nr:type II secretion system F family protein [Actinomycetota bacterium]